MFDPQQLQQATPQDPTTVTAVTSLSNTFLLHSNPFATKTIYLDFNGHILPANTGWTNSYTLAMLSMRPPGVWMRITRLLVMQN